MVDLTDKKIVKELVDACVKGDRKSQELFYKLFYGKMMAVCMRYTRNREEAQDILHDGMIKVYTKLKSFENKGSLEGWVRRIIVNNAIDSLRTRRDFLLKEDQEFILTDIVDDAGEEIELKRLRELKVEKIISLIQKLSPAYQLVFNMYAIENLSHKEIAEKLNINIGTSKSNLAKAKMRMKELVEKHWKEFMYE